MNKSTIFSSLGALGALTLSTQAATVTIPHTAFDGLNGLASGSITTTVIENGVTADITLTLTASAPGSTGTPPVTFQEGTRLGITSSFDQGNAPTTSINEGEILTIAVTSSVTSTAGVPAGQMVAAIDFGIPRADMVISGGANGSNNTATYTWASSAATTTANSSGAGAQNNETFDGTSLFDILSATYTGTFSVVETDGTTSGFRLDTNPVNDAGDLDLTVNISLKPIPEPSSSALFGLGALALLARRKK